MKLLIIEGIDRTGKNTLISNLLQFYSNVVIRHFSSAYGLSNIDKYKFQFEFFQKEFMMFRNNSGLFSNPISSKRNEDLWIWNRSHIGEKVYGGLYRKTPTDWIYDMEKQFSFDIDPNIYVVNLYGDPEFLFYNEDGLSIGKTLENKSNEIQAFREAVSLSSIKNKISIRVDDGFNNYIDSDIITSKVLKFINDEN